MGNAATAKKGGEIESGRYERFLFVDRNANEGYLIQERQTEVDKNANEGYLIQERQTEVFVPPIKENAELDLQIEQAGRKEGKC